MKPDFTVRDRRGQRGAGRGNQPAGGVPVEHEKRPDDSSAEGFRTIWTVRGFMLVQSAIFLVLVSIHFGLLLDGYRHRSAGTTESLIAAVLAFGFLLTWAPTPWSRRAAIAAQSFGTLGVLVGLFTFAFGIGPRTILDLGLNVILLLILIAGLACTKRGAGNVRTAWMVLFARRTQPPHPS